MYEWMKGPTTEHIYKCVTCDKQVLPWQVFCNEACRPAPKVYPKETKWNSQ